jgi:hypothetical protein
MLWYITINIIIALLTILLLQYIWNYLKDNYSTKKTKDLAEFQAQKYKDMFLTLSNSPDEDTMRQNISVDPVTPTTSPISMSASTSSVNIEWLNPNEEQWMTQELGSFMNDLLIG